MKQLAFALGGRPVANDDFALLQTELTAAVQATLWGLGPCVVSGCVVSGPAGGADIAAGIVWLDGQLLRFAGASGVALPAQFQAGAVVESDPRPYQTGGTKNCMREVPAVVVASDPTYSVGEFLAVDTCGALTTWHRMQERSRAAYETQTLGSGGYVPANYDADGLGKPGTEAWGWRLANGQGGTDDLRGRSVAGVDDSRADYAPGQPGGHDSITLQTANLPANPPGTHDVYTYLGNGQGYNVQTGGANGWQGRQPPAGIGQAIDSRSAYRALVMRQWVGY